MKRSQIEAYEQKLAHFEADNIIYQDQISRLRRRLIELEEYRIKYELLLQKQVQESPLQRSRRVDQINNMNRKIEQNNDKWTFKLKVLEKKYEQTIGQLENDNVKLHKKLQEQQEKSSLSHKQSLQLFAEVGVKKMKTQIQRLKSQNTQLNSQLDGDKKFKISQQHQIDSQIEQARNNEKQFYRNAILQLQKNIENLKQQVAYHQKRASPERQKQIGRLNAQIQQLLDKNQQENLRLNLLIIDKNNQIQHLTQKFVQQKTQAFQTQQGLKRQLESAHQKIFNIEQQTHSQVMACRMQMGQVREKQIQLMKDSFRKIQDSFDSERQQWKLILKQQEDQLLRIKQMWDEEKKLYIEEKTKLKNKIAQLKDRLKKSSEEEKELAQNQTLKMIHSLKQIDDFEDKYNDYENGITFLHRQLKRATVKIQEKNRQISKLLQELTVQREQCKQQIDQIKKVQRQQANYFRQKLAAVDETNSKLLQQIREKQKYVRDKNSEHKQIYKKLTQENQALKKIIEEMERDYRRITDNRKDLYRSYRSERDNVFTGKAQLNQERKGKWLQLDRQKNELQISYKQRERHIISDYELKINELQERLSKMNNQNSTNSVQLQILKQTLQNKEQQKAHKNGKNNKNKDQDDSKDLYKKLASLDLQISLAQNIFSSLNNGRHRVLQGDEFAGQEHNQKSELDRLSMNESDSITSAEKKIQNLQEMSLDQDDFVTDNVAPTFSRPYHNANFDKKVKTINYANAGLQMSFHPAHSDQEY